MKTILITGASSGIGRATAKYFAAKGWNVVASMRNPDQEKELPTLKNISLLRLDVLNKESIEQAVAKAIEQFESIDVVVNNAGYGVAGVFESSLPDQVRKQYEVNVFGLMEVTRTILPFMRQRHSGTIVNISSFGGITALPFGSIYNSSKFAVEGFSESLYHELFPLGIKVKVIEPGSIATSFRSNMEMVSNQVEEYNPVIGTFFERFGSFSNQHANATAEDVAETIFEASTNDNEQLRYVVGNDARLYIDMKLKNDESAFLSEIKNRFGV